jgi:hypothetical protein
MLIQFRGCLRLLDVFFVNVARLWENAAKTPSVDDQLIQAYLAQLDRRLHIRRTLDQFYYIGIEDTEDRDVDQVAQRYVVKQFGDITKNQEVLLESELLMVDQLWLWIFGKGLSSCPYCFIFDASISDVVRNISTTRANMLDLTFS